MSYTRTLCQSVCLQSKHLGTDDITFISDREKTERKKNIKGPRCLNNRVLEKCMHNTYQSKI